MSPATLTPKVLFDKDFIILYQALEADLCREIIALFDSDQNKWRGKIGGVGNAFYQDDSKISWDLEILNEGPWKQIFQKINPKVQACIAEYIARSPILRSFNLQGSGYKIQMYPKNEGRFLWHADSVGSSRSDRVISMVLYLNDVEEGGETDFFHQGIKISPKAGNLVLFPPSWNYMHCGYVPTSGDKYIISTFVKVKM